MKRLVLLTTVLLAATSAFASEGMWMPQQVPQIAAKLKAAGLQFDPIRLADLTGDPMGAVISLGGCTASFVSPDGLVVTNHHCGFGALQNNSTKDRDLITNGFLAKTRDEELSAGAGQKIWVTTKIEDVTDRVLGKIDAKDDVARDRMLERRQKELTAECEKAGGVRCRVAGFFEGSQYLRTTQMEIQDVRLVYAPANSVGDFGGDIDNFEWPRHTGDFSFLRAYVGKDGKPAPYSKDNVPFHPTHFLKVSSEGMNAGDFVLVAGYPGRTFRYRTSDEVRNSADFTYPTTVRYLTDLNNILETAGKGNRGIQIRNAARIKGNANTLKNYQSTVEGFTKDRIVDARLKREADLRAWIAASPAASKKYAGVLDEMAKINAGVYSTRERDLVAAFLGRSSPMFAQAMAIYRLSVERPRPDVERMSGYQERDLSTLKSASDRASRTIEPASDRAGLRYFLLEAQKLPVSERLKGFDDALAATGAPAGEAQVDSFLEKLYATTKIGDASERVKMLGETTAQLDARNDGMLQLAAAILPVTMAREERERATGGAMSRVRPLYFEALREMTGGTLYPDANSTLRITFGNLEGYKKDAVSYSPQTSLTGVLEKDNGVDPFDSPKALLAAARDPQKTRPYVDEQLGAVPVDFLSTCDTTGGNSGSPTLNAKGELCGLLFDGNYESIDADFLFNPAVTRSIHVDTQYMLWVMDAVDNAQNLMREMGVPVKVGK